jgi:hypothetical protein
MPCPKENKLRAGGQKESSAPTARHTRNSQNSGWLISQALAAFKFAAQNFRSGGGIEGIATRGA